MEVRDAQAIYAQSSDIKSRSYLDYRSDMKKKAIAELETVDWLAETLKAQHNTSDVRVQKSGGDKHIWFSRGKISGEPDYLAIINGVAHKYEFQYADSAELEFYDFKVSKVGKKVKGKRQPHQDRKFLYILKPLRQWAIITPQWVMDNGKEAGVPAWGNRTAYRIPRDVFQSIFTTDPALAEVIGQFDRKNQLLEFQKGFLKNESSKLSKELEDVVDREQAFQIIPKTLGGFYKACFLMEKLQKYPANRAMWLVYGASFCSTSMNSKEVAMLIYALDFLYGGMAEVQDNELHALVGALKKITEYLQHTQDAGLKTCADFSPREEALNFAFTVNLYEDMTQELRYLHQIDTFAPVNKIFQTVRDVDSLLKQGTGTLVT